MGAKFRLVGASVENLRGYAYAEISFPQLRILVGENNEGKSSLLKMIFGLVSEIDMGFWDGDRYLSEAEYQFWMPANNVAKKARRLSLRVQITDGRSARAFGGNKDDIFELRLGIRKTDGQARLNLGKPRRAESHDPQATELLRRLRESLELVLIPPVRDASNLGYTNRLLQDTRDRLKEKLIHTRHGGTSAEYRKAKTAIDAIATIVDGHADAFELTGETVLARMIRSSSIRFRADIGQLTDWMLDNIGVVISTGTHDELMVDPSEVGNGLQSLIDLSIVIARAKSEQQNNRDVLLFVEEPEVFLHPSAQRELMASIREYCSSGQCRIVLTTHSPIIVDEAEYPEVALVRDHRIFEPEEIGDDKAAINSGMLSARAAELFFSRMVVLVEGPSDCAYLSGIIRRLRKANPSRSGLSRLHVQEVGGKSQFAPWVKLLESYRHGDTLPIEYMCLADADAVISDSGSKPDLEKTFELCGLVWGPDIEQAAKDLACLTYKDFGGRLTASRRLNELLGQKRFSVFPVDLEWAVVERMSDENRESFVNSVELTNTDTVQLARDLGSKADTGKSKKSAKPAWRLAQAAKTADKKEVAREITQCLDHLFARFGYTRWRTLELPDA